MRETGYLYVIGRMRTKPEDVQTSQTFPVMHDATQYTLPVLLYTLLTTHDHRHDTIQNSLCKNRQNPKPRWPSFSLDIKCNLFSTSLTDVAEDYPGVPLPSLPTFVSCSVQQESVCIPVFHRGDWWLRVATTTSRRMRHCYSNE